MTTDTTITAPDPPPPKRKPANSPNKQKQKPQIVDLADRYKIAYTEVWTRLPKWKQVAIEDDKKKGITDGRFMKEFIQAVERQAENT